MLKNPQMLPVIIKDGDGLVGIVTACYTLVTIM